MSAIGTLLSAASNRPLRFVVIGGYAVTAHGYMRSTGDIDFLISSQDREAWKEFLFEYKFSSFQEHAVFMRFELPTLGGWPVDLMIVEPDTFEKLSEAAILREVEGVSVKIPDILHLIALKLHAAKSETRHSSLKDINDIVLLTHNNKLDIRSKEFQEIVDRYGNKEIWKAISAQLAK